MSNKQLSETVWDENLSIGGFGDGISVSSLDGTIHIDFNEDNILDVIPIEKIEAYLRKKKIEKLENGQRCK